MPSRYSGLTREQQARRNRSAAAQRTNSYFRTAADRGNGVSSSSVQSNSVRNRLGERVSPRTGRLITGSGHNSRYRDIRRAMGLSAG